MKKIWLRKNNCHPQTVFLSLIVQLDKYSFSTYYVPHIMPTTWELQRWTSLNASRGCGNLSCTLKKMSKFQELNRRRIISAGTGKHPHPERPCVRVTICSCRWDLLLLPFPYPTAISCQMPKRPSAISPLCFIPTLTYPPEEACLFLRVRPLPPFHRWLLHRHPSLSSPPPP